MTAGLDREIISLGEQATFSITFSGGEPDALPNIPSIPNLQISYIGPSSQISIINGRMNSTVTHNFRLAPRQSGEFTIPGLTAKVDAQTLSTQPVTLRVLKPNAPTPAEVSSGSQLAFLKLVIPRAECYVGETVLIQFQLYLHRNVQNITKFEVTDFPIDGATVGKYVDGQRSTAQVGNSVYTVIPVFMPVKPSRLGPIQLGPASVTVVLQLPSNRRRDPFDPFSIFGGGLQQQQMALATETASLHASSLPTNNVPSSFSGAVGTFSLSVSAGPTNVAVGDPITLKVAISGRGALDSITLPDQPDWPGFKAYAPTVKTDTTDTLGLEGTKFFEQVIVPERADIRAIPPIQFSFFDPEKKAYQTASHPGIPLIVKPASASAPPTIASRQRTGEEPPPPQDIVPIKQKLAARGVIPGHGVGTSGWSLGLHLIPVVFFLGAYTWRKQADSLARNPRLRRQRAVAQRVREGLHALHQQAAQNNSDAFFATLVHLLQEQLGERLDLPASAITEAVIDEHLRGRQVSAGLIEQLHDLFQLCNQARYAPIKSSQELSALIPGIESALRRLGEVSS